MKKVLLFICVAALLQSVAFGTVIGTWSKTTNGDTDVWTLTVTPNAGENIVCFDIWAYTSTTGEGPLLVNPTPPITNASPDCYGTVDGYTHFLYDLGHGSGKSAVMDAAEVVNGVDPGGLHSILAFAAGGAYDHRGTGGVLGFTTATNVLQLAVPTTCDPFSINYALPSGLNALCTASCDKYTPAGATDNAPEWLDASTAIHQIAFVPEPGTFALFGCGLLGLLVYAWRKRE